MREVRTHCLMICPPERTIGSRYRLSDVEFIVRIRKWYATERRVVREVAESIDFFERDLHRRKDRGTTFPVVCSERDKSFLELRLVDLSTAQFGPLGV